MFVAATPSPNRSLNTEAVYLGCHSEVPLPPLAVLQADFTLILASTESCGTARFGSRHRCGHFNVAVELLNKVDD
jgi:hypothetical protein